MCFQPSENFSYYFHIKYESLLQRRETHSEFFFQISNTGNSLFFHLLIAFISLRVHNVPTPSGCPTELTVVMVPPRDTLYSLITGLPVYLQTTCHSIHISSRPTGLRQCTRKGAMYLALLFYTSTLFT